jgi:hypothetical protein
MLAQGGVVAKGVFAIMVIMSFASWYIMLTKLWDQRRMRKAYKEVEKGFWTAGNLRDGIAKLSGKDNAFKMIAEDGIRAAQHHEGGPHRPDPAARVDHRVAASLGRQHRQPSARADSPCWPPPARTRVRSSDCSARSGALQRTDRDQPSPARRASTKTAGSDRRSAAS